MKIKQTFLLAAFIFLSSVLVTGVFSPQVFAGPGDSKAECEALGGVFENVDYQACNLNVDQDKCNEYGGQYNIGMAGTQLACIVKKGATPGTGETCGDLGGCESTEDIKSGCSGLSLNILKCDTKGGDPVTSLVLQIINFVAVGVGIAVVGGIIWGGMIYASSNGDSAKTKQAVSIIVNAVIGLLLFIFMYAILNFIVPGGLFT